MKVEGLGSRVQSVSDPLPIDLTGPDGCVYPLSAVMESRKSHD